jgi:hypothetical protein
VTSNVLVLSEEQAKVIVELYEAAYSEGLDVDGDAELILEIEKAFPGCASGSWAWQAAVVWATKKEAPCEK